MPVQPENTALENHCVVVSEGRILDIMPSKEVSAHYSAHRTVRLHHHALIPGLVNAHTHLPLNFFRGLADDKPLMEWLTMDIWPAEGRLMSPMYASHGARAAAAECIRSGVTAVNDMYFFGDAIAEELYEIGMRARIGAVCLEFPTPYAQNADEYLRKGEELYHAWKSRDPTGKFDVKPTYQHSIKVFHWKLPSCRSYTSVYCSSCSIHC